MTQTEAPLEISRQDFLDLCDGIWKLEMALNDLRDTLERVYPWEDIPFPI